MWPSYGSLSVDLDNSKQLEISSELFGIDPCFLIHLQMYRNSNLTNPSNTRFQTAKIKQKRPIYFGLTAHASQTRAMPDSR